MFLMFAFTYAQSPHGEELKINCNQCHNPSGWEMDVYLMRFDHNKTDFNLVGAHTQTDCKACHSTLVFNETPNQCASCHEDIHSASVGNDCVRCHTPTTWLVDNIPELHEENGFPLIGSHGNLSCVDCHSSETDLRFDNVGNDCISCHRDDYLATQSPDHSNFSTDCIECHNPIGIGWETDIVGDHDFFPLTLGHDNLDCVQCHTTDDFSDADPNCVSCHQPDYEGTSNPNHNEAGFSTDCASCHTTNPGWTPANINHDFFPLTLGHDIQDCTQCHTTPNYSEADPNCVSCHQPDYEGTSNPNHNEVGYSTDCASCHTTNPGWTPANIDHNFFPLTLGHDIQDCTQCHTTANYSDADPNCVSCHQTDYDGSTDPNHNDAQFPTDCVTCHTTNPNWTPVTWNHNDFYPLNGAHALIASDCLACHSAGYENTPNTCVGCHQTDYDNTTDPNHTSAQFPTDCMECHNENTWEPSTFDHDGQYFPIYSGKHDGEWDTCIECHTNPNDYSEVNGYVYASSACLECHPNGED